MHERDRGAGEATFRQLHRYSRKNESSLLKPVL